MSHVNGNTWWFGVNNLHERDRQSRVVIYPEIKRFVYEIEDTFDWPCRGNNNSCYGRMLPGDRGLLWMGHNARAERLWGILGFVKVRSVNLSHVVLEMEESTGLPISPYAAGDPRDMAGFNLALLLRRLFGAGKPRAWEALKAVQMLLPAIRGFLAHFFGRGLSDAIDRFHQHLGRLMVPHLPA